MKACLFGAALLLVVSAATAHHSYTMFDGSKTLVVETIGVDPEAHFPDRGPGTPAIGKNVRISERITRASATTLEIEVTIVAPEILTRPDHRKRLYTLAAGKSAARDVSFCVDYDRAIDPRTGKQRFDLSRPAHLPPPSAQAPKKS